MILEISNPFSLGSTAYFYDYDHLPSIQNCSDPQEIDLCWYIVKESNLASPLLYQAASGRLLRRA